MVAFANAPPARQQWWLASGDNHLLFNSFSREPGKPNGGGLPGSLFS
jgi:hypothetical protein